MSVDWRTMTLNQAGVILIDCDHKTPKAVEHGQPYIGIPQLKNGRITLAGARLISPEDFSHWRRKALPIPNDVVLSRRCNPGETAYVSEGLNIALGQNLVLLRATNANVYPPFLRWLTQGPAWWNQVNNFINVGAVFNSLKCVDIPKFSVYLPPYKKQIKISEILCSLDEKIQINEHINKTLEQMAQALFKSWFVDFDPVKAKIAVLESGGSQEEALLAAMTAISGKDANALVAFHRDHPEQYAELKTTAELFPSAMQESELGEIPEGWEIKPLDSIASYQNGLALQKFRPKNEKDFLPVVKIAQLKKGFADGEEKASSDIKPECIIDNGDVIFSWSGSLMVDIWCGGKAALNQHLFKVTSTQYPKWLYYRYTVNHLNDFRRIAEAKAVTMGHIKREHLSQAKCIIPSFGVINALTIFFDPLLNRIVTNRLESQTLETSRDILLPKLLSGEITLPEAEASVCEATHG